MSVVDGTPVDAPTTNPAFLKPDVDDYTVSRLGARRGTGNGNPPSGSWVQDFQRYTNNLGDVIGLDVGTNFSGEADTTGKTYGLTSNLFADGTTHKLALKALGDTYASTIALGGHGHTGNGSDGPPIDLSTSITGVLQESGGGTGKTSWTPGSVVWAGPSTLAEDNLNFFWDITTQRLGLGNNTPRTQLDLQGDLSMKVSVVADAGPITGLATDDELVIELPSSPQVQGLANGVEGKIVYMLDTSGAGFGLDNDSSGAAVGSRIYTGAGEAITGSPYGCIPLVYSETTQHWHPAGGGGGGGGSDLVITDFTASPLVLSDEMHQRWRYTGTGLLALTLDQTAVPDGARVEILGTSDDDQVTLDPDTDVLTNGSWTGSRGSFMALTKDAGLAALVEESRNGI